MTYLGYFTTMPHYLFRDSNGRLKLSRRRDGVAAWFCRPLDELKRMGLGTWVPQRRQA